MVKVIMSLPLWQVLRKLGGDLWEEGMCLSVLNLSLVHCQRTKAQITMEDNSWWNLPEQSVNSRCIEVGGSTCSSGPWQAEKPSGGSKC